MLDEYNFKCRYVLVHRELQINALVNVKFMEVSTIYLMETKGCVLISSVTCKQNYLISFSASVFFLSLQNI